MDADSACEPRGTTLLDKVGLAASVSAVVVDVAPENSWRKDGVRDPILLTRGGFLASCRACVRDWASECLRNGGP